MKKIFLFLFSLTIVLFVFNYSIEASEGLLDVKISENITQDNLSINIGVMIEFDYEPLDNSNINESDPEKYLKKVRKNNQKYYSKMNNKLIKEHDLKKMDFAISEFSPFIYKEYETYTAYLLDRQIFIDLSEEDDVEFIYVSQIIREDSSVGINETNTTAGNITLSEAKTLINATNTTYTGLGVKIAILEQGREIDSSNFLNGQIKRHDYDPINKTEHATRVASIIGGDHGIATEAELYFFTKNALIDSLNYLLKDNIGINIINISQDLSNGTYGSYLGYDKVFDHYSSHNLVTIVVASGNDTNLVNSKYIASPAMGLNVITVGSVDRNINLSYYSCYTEAEGFEGISKPNLVAPGENIVIPNFSEVKSGTSFAAPMVTGVIALLMQESPTLKIKPDLVNSILMSSATMLDGQTDLMDNAVGAGLVNYQEARDVFNSTRFSLITVDPLQAVDTIVSELTVNIQIQKEVRFTLIQSAYMEINAGTTTVTSYEFSRYIINIYNSSGELFRTITSESNIFRFDIENPTDNLQTYVIKIVKSTYYSDDAEVEHHLALSYSDPHDIIHNYTYSCIKYTESLHKKICHCGAYEYESHVIGDKWTDVEGNIYGTCTICKSTITIQSSSGGGTFKPIIITSIEEEDEVVYN